MDIKLIFKYYWPHIKRYKKSTLLVFVAYFVAIVGSDIFLPLLYKEIVDIVSGASTPSLVSGELMLLLLFLGVVIFTNNLFYRVADYAITYSQSHCLKDVTDDAFNRLQVHSYAFFSNNFSGSLVARMKRYVGAFEMIYDQFVFTVWFGGLKLIFAFGVLLWVSPPLAGIFLIWLIFYIAVTSFFVKKKIKKDLKEAEANSKVTGVLSDVITNILNVKMFASQKKELLLFADTTKEEEKYRRQAWNFNNLQMTFQGYFIGVFEFVGMYAVILLWTKGIVSAGTIMLMQIYIFSTFQTVWNIGRNFTRMMSAFAEAKEMVDIFEELPAVRDISSPEKCKINKGHIKINNISFSYGADEEVFKDFSLDIKPGERVGFVGPSGAGKTTITKLLLRFADVQKGEIEIDGQNITHITQNDLRSNISYVPQDPVLFHRTLKENIAYSCADCSDESVISAAKSAHAHKFIASFPKGYDTLVGERGIKLSGGERQRVAIARAMLKDAPIIIFDEATSSLDSISEHHIQKAFDNLMKGRTTLVIAHRLSTIVKMDRIIVFENGVISEEGTHRELLAKHGLYYRLWKQQSHGFMGE